MNLGAAEMDQWLRASVALLQDPSLNPGTHMAAHSHLQFQGLQCFLLPSVFTKYARGAETHMETKPLYTWNKNKQLEKTFSSTVCCCIQAA